MGKVTYHARDRVKKRMGLPKRLTNQLAAEALELGSRQADFKGSFRRYLDKLGIIHHTSPVVHKGYVFIFSAGTLVTLWPVPQQFRAYTPRSDS